MCRVHLRPSVSAGARGGVGEAVAPCAADATGSDRSPCRSAWRAMGLLLGFPQKMHFFPPIPFRLREDQKAGARTMNTTLASLVLLDLTLAAIQRRDWFVTSVIIGTLFVASQRRQGVLVPLWNVLCFSAAVTAARSLGVFPRAPPSDEGVALTAG